jgi:predicted alpha/beta-fold hydrolase
MIRFQRRLNAIGIRTFRLDMRGCGASGELCSSITHAGRSEDILSAVEFIGRLVDDPSSPIGGVGVSLGGNQWLLAAGRVGKGEHSTPKAWPRVGPILAIAPAMDLQACSDAMQSPHLRFYNWYFIHHLLKRASTRLRANPIYQESLAGPKPKTLRQFDRTFTAPLGGFESESDYYQQSSAVHVVGSIKKPTLIVTAKDDPLVPIDSFEPVRGVAEQADSPVRLHVTTSGGHHGYLQRGRTSWTDELVTHFFDYSFLTKG